MQFTKTGAWSGVFGHGWKGRRTMTIIIPIVILSALAGIAIFHAYTQRDSNDHEQ